jgi:ParB family chromosome partitioning protein
MESLVDIPIDQIEVNPNQPRKVFDFTALDELAASIKSSGVIQPIIVRRVSGFYQLIAGERRWRAARQAGLDRIPAIVRDATDAQSIELALVENLLREDLNPIETAQAYQKLLAEFGWTQEELAQRIGKDRTSIANGLRLLRLPEDIQADLRSGRLTMGHARALLALTDDSAQRRLAREVVSRGLSVRETEALVRRESTPAVAPPPRKVDPNTRAAEDRLKLALGTRVRIVRKGTAGRIEIDFGNENELQRLFEVLTEK